MSKDNLISIKLITGKKVLYTKGNNNNIQYFRGQLKDISKGEDKLTNHYQFKIINPVKMHLSTEEYKLLKIDNTDGVNVDYKNLQKDISSRLNTNYGQIRANGLNNFIGKDYNNIVVLAGAGSSISTKAINDGRKSGLTMYGLANNINRDLIKYNKKSDKKSYYSLLKIAKYAKFFNVNKKHLNEFKQNNERQLKSQTINLKKSYHLSSHKDIYNDMALIFNNFELLLSTVIEYKDFVDCLKGPKKINGVLINPTIYDNTIREINRRIRYYCQLKFNKKYFKHDDFIQELQRLNVHGKRLKIYSTNYDTLFEQAAERIKALVIDGFNFRPNRVFNENSLNVDFIKRNNDDEDINLSNSDLYPNVVKIFQIHGSEDWYKDTVTGKVYKADHNIVTAKLNGDYDKLIKKESNEKESITNSSKSHNRYEPCMIFPSNNKYEQSYNDPYFDLFLNFQRDLHENNTLLVIVGFSLSDMHIRRMVYDAMLVNKHLSMVFVSFSGVSANEDKNTKNDKEIKQDSKYIKVTINNSNLNKFFTAGLLSRELFLSGTLSDFTDDLNIPKIYK